MHRVLIVGGGAGGLELATRLGHLFSHSQNQVVLVDASLTHIWKPLLHEVAAGTLDTGNHEIDYLAHARQHGFQFHLGSMVGLDRTQKRIELQAIVGESGHVLAPKRTLEYDTLVIAIGSLVNDFHTPGVKEYALSLNNVEDARHLHQHLFTLCLRANEGQVGDTDIAIVGGGATGVELAAELRQTLNEYARYTGSKGPTQVRISLIEAGANILANLQPGLRQSVLDELTRKGVEVRTQTQVKSVERDGLRTTDERFISAHIVIWAAGVKGPEILATLDGLEANKTNQLVVTESLQTTRDENIFAMGDCAAFTPSGAERPIPPLAQAAHQQALHLSRVLPQHILGRKTLPPFEFQNHGTLISLGPTQAVGSLIGRITGRRIEVGGWLAYLSYRALYLGYRAAIHGWLKTFISALGDRLTQSTKSRVKLH